MRKHREKILLLVKMMYLSYGESLPCFKGGFLYKFSFFKVFLGESCIWELEKRLNPPNLKDDGDLNIFIQK